jgi:(S)-ureidoglycine aminohydrolase
MEISALTRSVVKRNHAFISPDGYINSNVPGWENCTVNVIINEQMGANLCQTLITAGAGCTVKGATKASQIFFYMIEGSATANINTVSKPLIKGQFVYVPIGKDYLFNDVAPGTQILTFHKVYENLEGYDVPGTYFGDQAEIEGPIYMNDEALRIQVLLPSELGYDMAVNIFTYQTGGNLPMVETHIMEHGLIYLQGQGIYMLDHEWYPIKKGDSLWMAPYCQQWFTAMGKEPAVYIYYKNVNRFPTTI